jgi:hypothetical protein
MGLPNCSSYSFPSPTVPFYVFLFFLTSPFFRSLLFNLPEVIYRLNDQSSTMMSYSTSYSGLGMVFHVVGLLYFLGLLYVSWLSSLLLQLILSTYWAGLLHHYLSSLLPSAVEIPGTLPSQDHRRPSMLPRLERRPTP